MPAPEMKPPRNLFTVTVRHVTLNESNLHLQLAHVVQLVEQQATAIEGLREALVDLSRRLPERMLCRLAIAPESVGDAQATD